MRTGGVLLDGTTLKRRQKLDLRMRRVGFGVEGEGCSLDLQRGYEESEQLLRTVHRI